MWSNIFRFFRPKERQQPEPAAENLNPMIDQKKFIEITELVIDQLEGGYYHPRMKARFSPADQKIMGDSGETMFGLDRKHGAQLAKYPEWAEFWGVIDSAQPPFWKHYYRGGPLEAKLRRLAAEIMFKWFLYLSLKYLNDRAVKAIGEDPRLMLHFSYASWNGEGWFRRFSDHFKKVLDKHEGNKEAIWTEAIKARTESSNAVIRRQAKNMLRAVSFLK